MVSNVRDDLCNSVGYYVLDTANICPGWLTIRIHQLPSYAIAGILHQTRDVCDYMGESEVPSYCHLAKIRLADEIKKVGQERISSTTCFT